MKPTKASMRIVEHSSSPMVAGRESDLDISDAQKLPRFQLVYSIKPKIMHQIPNPARNNNGLPGGNSSQSSPIQMVKMSMRHEHKIDRGEMFQWESRATNAFDNFQPERPDRIHHDIQSPPLDQKRRVTDPGQANIVRGKLRKFR